ncbi:ISAs1 family transposase [Endozoicomonas sp. Mp262]|uniref:ISAs1 family transposase n=1 Tax=Endozoicomonas sp. Mp262 TaxID=2919499 RepID=UPI0021D832AE
MSAKALFSKFTSLTDKRDPKKSTHILAEVMFISVCAILCGADDWNGIRLFAEHKEGWLRKHLTLPGGIPVAVTFNRIFATLDPEEFRKIFIQWIRDVLSGLELSDSKIVALDGKTVKGSAWNKGKDAIHMLNAWCTEAGLSLGQYKVDEKSNEITAIPELLKLLELSGSLVTIDAMGCQKKIATAILKKEADYLLAVKGNQRKLYGEVTRLFDQYWQDNLEDAPDHYFAEQEGKEHGRMEHRRCWVINDVTEDSNAASWKAKTIAAIQLDSSKKGKGKTLIRYFICSRQLSAAEVLQATRKHWLIENQLHWVLDVAFDEDRCRAREGFAAENLAVARQVTLNLLKLDTTVKAGIKNKRKTCGWNEDYMMQVLKLVDL